MLKGKVTRQKPLILVVDDFKATLFMIRQALQQRGYAVVESENGQEALHTFQEMMPDLVIMDIEMPVMDGLTACRYIKKLPVEQQAPVLVCTGTDDEKSVENAFAAGADDFITKPVNWEELAHRVRRLLYLKEMEETIGYQSHYDRLTGLPNRLLFQDRLNVALQQVKKENRMLAVIMLDMKDFKSINDAFGYDQGDLLLQEIARRIQNYINDSVTLARLGGDRFALVMPDIRHTQDAAWSADHIEKSVARPWQSNGHEVKPKCRLGIAVYPNDGDTGQALLANAETAMYLAANEPGTAYRYYNQQMNTKAFERLSLENSLYHALDRQEFVVYYQPVVSLRSGKITGLEALLRWQKPGQGMISPAQFIPLTEKTGLILPIGTWVLREACALGKTLQEKGYLHMTVSVNLSPLQFLQHDLVQMIARILKETSFEPSLLKLEITETFAMKDLDYTIKTMERIKEMGVKISIDDFGTGYSSLSSIKNMPFDELKIDMSFIRDIAHNPLDKVIVETIIALGKGLKVNLVAEGVETEEQLSLLKEMECNQVQGYLFGKPVGAENLTKLLTINLKHIHQSPDE